MPVVSSSNSSALLPERAPESLPQLGLRSPCSDSLGNQIPDNVHLRVPF